MGSFRLWRAAVACRLFQPFRRFSTFFLLPLALVPAVIARAAADTTVVGTVVDQAGHALPRARVLVLSTAGAQTPTVYTDEAGRFRLDAPAADCRVGVQLTGFTPIQAVCGTGDPLRLVLPVAPIAEQIVVTATRTDAPADQVGVSVTTFTADDLARRQQPLIADLLRASPGAVVVRGGGLGGVTSLFVRGGESSYNKVLLDGIPLEEPGGRFDFSNLTTAHVERVEIVRGAQSALFGSDAMASVVQLFTKRPDRTDRRPHADVTFEGGSYGTFRESAAVSGASGRGDFSLGAARFDTDNRDPNGGFGNTTLSATGGFTLNGTMTLRFVGRGELQRAGTPGQTAFGRPDRDAFFDRHDGTGGVTFDHQVTPAFRQRATYSLSLSRQQSTNLLVDPPYTPRFGDRSAPFAFSDFPYDSVNNLQRHHASYQADWRAGGGGSGGNHLLTFIADWDGERARLDDRLDSTLILASRNNLGASFQDQVLWSRLFLTLGGRVERNENFGTTAVPRGSVVVVARPSTGAVGDTRIKASAGLGIKEPTIIQSFSPSPFFRGNPDLRPERSRTMEAGIEQRLADDRVKVEATWFDNRFSNIIATRTTDPATFAAQFFNIGLSRARGAEFSLEAAPTRHLRGRGGYTWLDSAILDSTSPTSVVFQPGQALFRRPRHSGYAGLSWDWRQLSLDMDGVFVGTAVDSDFSSLTPPLLTNPAHTTWNGRARYRVSTRVQALLSIDNLTNAEYMEALGYPALRRAFRAGVRIGL